MILLCLGVLTLFGTIDGVLIWFGFTRIEACFFIVASFCMSRFTLSPIQEISLNLGSITVVFLLSKRSKLLYEIPRKTFVVVILSLLYGGALRAFGTTSTILPSSVIIGALSSLCQKDKSSALFISSIIPLIGLMLSELLCLVFNGFCELNTQKSSILTVQLLSICTCALIGWITKSVQNTALIKSKNAH
ncbi:MAG: hypothetical protein MSS81_05915 [Clostridiales bacterium]|nr:hypothetical protein [Clostridiales bacterium]MDD7550118.1 hypothetical protein [Clostridia bacterium]MDY5754812.1 hypothetical protein [Eubacteriales bacterium]